MPTRIIPKKYVLRPKDRKALASYLAGEIGTREAGKIMNVDHQNIPRIATSIMRHAVMTKKIDAKELLSNY